MKAIPKQEHIEMPKTQQQIAGQAGVDLQSEVDLNPQFQLNQDFDIDIFSNKKRVMKFNEEQLAEGSHQTNSTLMNMSEQKLVYRDKVEEISNIDIQIPKDE